MASRQLNNAGIPLLGMDLEELKSLVQEKGWPAYVAMQLAEWLYKHHAQEVDEMSNISKKVRSILKKQYVIGYHGPAEVQTSADGTKKYLFPVSNGGFVEAVYIPDGKRHTLCISSQTGCKMGCSFCMTARQGFQGQLTAGDIINQVRSVGEHELITNIVYMGMGEPLDNLDAVMKSLDILSADYGYGMSHRRITVSTIGMLPALKDLLQHSRCRLAISVHSPFPEEREKLVPLEKAHPIKEVIRTIREHDLESQRRISIEYIVFKDMNHSSLHAKALARLLKGLRCRINLIRFHPIPGSRLQSPDEVHMNRFKDMLEENGVITTIRRSRGQDIHAACGMLSTSKKAKLKDEAGTKKLQK